MRDYCHARYRRRVAREEDEPALQATNGIRIVSPYPERNLSGSEPWAEPREHLGFLR
jgi:hypothetical protein